jgi:hypothetical protein
MARSRQTETNTEAGVTPANPTPPTNALEVPNATKLCAMCGPARGPRPLAEFRIVGRGRKVYYDPYCLRCRADRSLQYYHEDRDRINALRHAKRTGDLVTVRQLARRLPAALREPVAIGYKRCPAPDCGRIRPLNEFWRSQANADGRQTWCIDCMRSRQRRIDTERRYFLILAVAGEPVGSQPPVPEAIRGQYTTQEGEIHEAWFVRLASNEEVAAFIERHGRIAVDCSAANPRILIIELLEKPAPGAE